MNAERARAACWIALIGLQAVSCGQTVEPDATAVDGGAARDASPTLSSDGTCDLGKPYSSPSSRPLVREATTQGPEGTIPFVDPTLTDDELTLFVHQGPRVYVSRRANLAEKFLEFSRLRGLESLDGIASLSVSGDGRRLYFVSTLKREFPNFDRDPRLRRAVREGDTDVYVIDAAPVLDDPMARAAVAAQESTVFFERSGEDELYERTRTPEGWRSARLAGPELKGPYPPSHGWLGAATPEGNGVLAPTTMYRRSGPDESFHRADQVLWFQNAPILYSVDQQIRWLGASGCRIYFTEIQLGVVKPVILFAQRPL